MNASTETITKVHPLIEKRWSPRAFGDQPVSEQQLELLFEAARWAPSAMNEQPWRFSYATREDEENFNQLFSLLMPGNSWAGKASALFIAVAKTAYTYNGNPNPHAWYDVGLATGNLLLQATELGLHVHLMAGFDAAKAREVLQIPEGYEPVAMGAVGYAGDPDSLPEQLKERELAPRQRKPLRELLLKGAFQKD